MSKWKENVVKSIIWRIKNVSLWRSALKLPSTTCARYSEKKKRERENPSCRFNKISTLINSARLRVSVIRSLARVASGNVIARAKVRRSGGESQWHKDDWSWGRTIPRIVFYDLLSSRRASFQYPRAAKRRILRLSLSLSLFPPLARIVLPDLLTLSTYLSTLPLYLPLYSSPLTRFLPSSLFLSDGNPSTSPRSILAKRPRGIDFNHGFADLFRRPVCLNRYERQRETERTVYGISSVFL